MATILKNNIENTCNCKNPDVKIEGDCQPPVVDVSTDDALNNYDKLINKPSINGHVLSGDKTGEDLGLVDAEEGKGLSTNDFTDEYKDKLEHIEPEAQRNVQSDWAQDDASLDDYIKNKPTKLSQFENDTDFDTQTGVRVKISQHNVDSDAHLDIRQSVTNETNRAIYAENSIRQLFNGEVVERQAGDAHLQELITTEAATRILGDTILQDNIDGEAVLRREADQRLQTNINAEAGLRTAADNVLQANINTEAGLRAAADSALQDQINAYDSRIAAEALARQQADTTLQQNIDTEAALRIAADTALGGRIDDEASARQGADEALGTRITNEETRAIGVEGTLSNLTTTTKTNLVSAINELDSTKQDNITGAATTITNLDLVASRALISSPAGKVAVSDITATELGYLDNATGNIQTQLDNKVEKNNAITAGTKCKITYDTKGLVTGGTDLVQSDIPALNLTKISDVTATATEVNYLSGVTSAVQTQLNNKVDKSTSNSVIYGTDDSGNQTTISYTPSLQNGAIVQRGLANGQIAVPETPTANAHAASKKYVDDKISAAISEAVVFKGTVADETLLPQSGNTNGDMYWITAFSNNPPTGMTAGRSGSAIWKSNGATGEWNYTQDSIYEPDEETIDLNANGELEVMVSSVANNAITKQSDGLHVDISGKVTKNNDITGATKCKITYDSKGLVTAGADLVASDIPNLSLSKITDVTATAAEVNVLDGITASTTELNILDGVTASASELNILDGATLDTTELNYLDGVTSSVQTQLDNKVTKNTDITGATKCKITYDSKGLVTAGADITLSDVTDITASTSEVNVLDGITASTAELNILDGVTASTAELNYVDGVTSNIQTQLNNKQATITGAASSVTDSDLTALRLLISDANGKIAASSNITATEASYLDGVTSNIQTQLNEKAVPADIGNATITFKANGSTIAGQSFTTNASTDVEIDLGNTGLVDDVQINGTSIVSNKVANIPYADGTVAGVVKCGGYGLQMATGGIIKISPAATTSIETKTGTSNPLTPNNIDLIVKSGLINNTQTMTASEKQSARGYIGATQVIMRDWM